MALTWLLGYRIQDGQASAFRDYLKSEDFRSLRDSLVAETGIRIVATYFEVEPSSHESSDYDAWDLWEVPDYAAIDRYVASNARLRFLEEYLSRFVQGDYKWITAQRAEYPG